MRRIEMVYIDGGIESKIRNGAMNVESLKPLGNPIVFKAERPHLREFEGTERRREEQKALDYLLTEKIEQRGREERAVAYSSSGYEVFGLKTVVAVQYYKYK